MSTPGFAGSLRYGHDGLIPAVIQDAATGDVLMVGYMNEEAVARTMETRRVTFWSRSRGNFWVKGETSGNAQTLIEARVDCDLDCLLLRVSQSGPACHEGYRSCFYRSPDRDGVLVEVADRMRRPEEMYGPGPTHE